MDETLHYLTESVDLSRYRVVPHLLDCLVVDVAIVAVVAADHVLDFLENILLEKLVLIFCCDSVVHLLGMFKGNPIH